MVDGGPMSENKGDAESHVVPRLYVDAGDVRVQLHSLHVILGQISLSGNAEPMIHVTMSPSFAVELSKALADAVRPYLMMQSAASAAQAISEPSDGG